MMVQLINMRVGSFLSDLMVIASLVIPGLTWLLTTSDLQSYFAYQNLDGQFLYVLSKLFGLYAVVFVWLQLLGGLLKPQVEKYYSPLSVRFHKTMGSVSFLLVILHVILFITAVSLRNDHIAWKLLIPKFDQGYYAFMLTMGLLALGLMTIGILARGVLLRYSSAKRWMHRFIFVAFYMVLLHSYTIGSETRVGAMKFLYLLMLVSISGALLHKILNYWRKGRHNAFA